MAPLIDVMLQSLANIPGNHPSLFGESKVIPAQPLIIEEEPTVLPRHLTSVVSDDWAIRFSQGIFNAAGDHIEALSDIRDDRRLFFPTPRLENALGYDPAKVTRKKFMLYGGISKFIQETELVEQLRAIPEIDIIYPEELSFEDKLTLWRSHSYIVGFPQGCLMLKPFVPHTTAEEIASMIFLLAGPGCLPST
jgi:hypothetical protein